MCLVGVCLGLGRTGSPSTKEDVEEQNTSSLLEGMQSGAVTREVNTLGIYPTDPETRIHIKTCTQKCTVAFFMIIKTQKKSRCLSIGEWIYKSQYNHTTDDTTQ